MDVSPRPNLLWRLFVLGGLGTAGAVTFSDEAWEQWQNVAGDAVPREAMRSVFLGSVGLHATESVFAYGSARRATLLWGFPVLRRLRKAKRLAAG